ncbi:hypothetical protein AZ66_28070, partial [Paenibacillus sp. E194]|uniref:RHS repeat domain-containing protein n=1 Tax=Paenibacillus sp. E194 TaxID=1458845 RepID=UPI0005CA9A37
VGRYEYDDVGNVQTAYDGNHNATKYEYDVLGRLIAVTDAEGKTTRYRYNLSGDMVEIKYADGNTVEKRYDEIGRLLQQIDPMKQSKRFYYDDNSNVVKSIDKKDQIQQFEYNNRNFLMKSTSPDENVTYSYDPTGKRTEMTDQTGTTTYAYDPSGELASITYPDQTSINYDYEIRRLRTEQTISTGNYKITQRISHTGILPNPTSMAVLDGSGSQLMQFEYKYDGSYNRLTELKSTQGFLENYAYDGFNLAGIQQKQGDALFGNYSYTYDNNRNITDKNDNGAGYQFSYDKLNRIKTSSQFNEAYAYDQRDNRSTLQSDQVPNIKGASYVYDSRNRLTQVTTEDGKAVSYRYNGDNLMVERTENGVATRYYYDDRAKIVAEGKVEGNGSVTITAAYVHDSTGKLLARQVPGQGMQYYVSNGHGDITEIRDAQGNVLNRYTYDIWGNPLVQEEQVPNIFRYSGEYWDAATNLQYLRARWYDPSVGRFINEDTYEGDIKNSLSLNLYTYVANNPLKFMDPSGHIPTVMEAAVMADHIYGATKENVMGVVINDWILEDIKTNWQGLKMGIYSRAANGKAEYALVNKGTTPTKVIDWINNIAQPFGESTDLKDSIEIASKFINSHNNSEVTMVGHSKGGAEAAANAIVTNKNAILFNPAKLSININTKVGLHYQVYTAKINAYVVNGDILNEMFGKVATPGGEVYYLRNQYPIGKWNVWNFTKNIENSIENHSMGSVINALKEKNK